MPLKSGEENRNFIECTIKLEKSQTETEVTKLSVKIKENGKLVAKA